MKIHKLYSLGDLVTFLHDSHVMLFLVLSVPKPDYYGDFEASVLQYRATTAEFTFDDFIAHVEAGDTVIR